MACRPFAERVPKEPYQVPPRGRPRTGRAASPAVEQLGMRSQEPTPHARRASSPSLFPECEKSEHVKWLDHFCQMQKWRVGYQLRVMEQRIADARAEAREGGDLVLEQRRGCTFGGIPRKDEDA